MRIKIHNNVVPDGHFPTFQLELLAKDELHGLGPFARIVQHSTLLVQASGHKMELDLASNTTLATLV
jgi:hypothetical protein